MRLLLDIRYGTERYPEKVARRLRTVNIGSRIAAASHAFFAALSFANFTQFWWAGLAHSALMLLFAGVPLLHRLGSQAGGIATLVLYYLDIIGFIYLAGTGVGL